MAQFSQIVLDYLRHYQPRKYNELRQQRQLRPVMETLVDALYEETARAFAHLEEAHPDQSEDLLMFFAEEQAVEAVLPHPHA